MEHTANLNLKKPGLTDNILISDINENMDVLDDAIGELQNGSISIPDLETTDKTLAGAINEVDRKATTIQQTVTEHLEEKASLTTSGHTQLSNAFDSTADTLAATPSAVKQAYDRGDSAFNNEAELRAEFNTFKSALTEGFTNNQFSDGLSSLNAFNVTDGYYNLPMTRLEV